MLKVRERVGDLFNRDDLGWAWSRRDCPTTIDLFLGAYAKGHLSVGLARIPLRHCLAAHAADPYPTGNESKRHARMKHAAVLWMRECGAADARDEVECAAGRADAYSATADWAVECGNTRIGKLVSCIECSKRPLFTLIPYQNEHRPDGRVRSLVGVHFAWSPQLTTAVRERLDRRAEAAAEAMRATFDNIFSNLASAPAASQEARI
ncbi:hypothetical protein [Methylobacterium thuringiense]|uniref:hypothetical protein n=1 Tax=Methylobacterium thuringiense TaxID=1003091 RepID=UPI001EDE772D|nr:hypothetical protein [Methylobacterium thuringiense]